MANLLNRNSLQGRLNRDVPEVPVWCSVGSLLAGRTGCAAGAGRVGRGRAVVACDAEAVTHFPDPIATHLHLLTQLTCITALTPSRAMLRPARHLCIHRAAHTHQDRRFFALIVTFLLRTYAE
jgi:hypothetical protein